MSEDKNVRWVSITALEKRVEDLEEENAALKAEIDQWREGWRRIANPTPEEQRAAILAAERHWNDRLKKEGEG